MKSRYSILCWAFDLTVQTKFISFSPGISAAARSFHPCADHTLISEEPLYCNTGEQWCYLEGKIFTLGVRESAEDCLSHNVLTVIQERISLRLTFCQRSTVQETPSVLPPQPDENKEVQQVRAGIMGCPVIGHFTQYSYLTTKNLM